MIMNFKKRIEKKFHGRKFLKPNEVGRIIILHKKKKVKWIKVLKLRIIFPYRPVEWKGI